MPPEKTLNTERERNVLVPLHKGRRPSAKPKNPLQSPTAKRLAQAMAGILAVAGAKAKADEFQVGRGPAASVLDIVDGDTGNPLPGSPVVIGTNVNVTGMQHIPEQGYSIISVVPYTAAPDRLLRRNDGSVTPTILNAPVDTPREIDYNPTEGTISVASQLNDQAILLDAADPNSYQNYDLSNGSPRWPVWTAFSQSGPTPFLVSIEAGDSKVRIYNPGGDLNGDGFPDDTTPTELVALSLGTNVAPEAAHYDRTNHVLYVACHNTRKLWAFDIDDTNTTTLAATQGQVVATFNFDPHDMHVTPSGTQLVVGGDSGTTAHLALIDIGTDAASATVAIADSIPVNRPLSDYQSLAFDTNGSLWAFIKQGIGGAPGYAIELDLSTLTPTGNQITFSGNQLGAGTIAQDPPATDPNDVDDDNDGLTENQGDCNDTDPTVWEESEFYVDADGDLVGDDNTPSGWFCGATEAAASGYAATTPGDCNDTNATVYPGAPEQCNGIDEDCDTVIDNGITFQWAAPDIDVDGFGSNIAAQQQYLCEVPSGWVTEPFLTDCNDTNPAIHPSATEPSCGGPDLNCDTFSPPACPGDIDGDGDGFTPNEGDCADGDPSINPGAPEVCDFGLTDENCDTQTDENGALGEVTVWPDIDGDTYGAAGVGQQDCPGTPGTIGQDGDCNDSDAAVHPGATEYADGRDKDCDTHPSATLNVPIIASTDDTLIGNPGIPFENGPNYIKGLGQSVNVKATQMAREYDEILGETQEVLGYQTVNPSAIGQLRVSREAGGAPIYVYQLPESAPPDYIPTWTAAVTGTVLEVLDQPSGIVRLSVIEGTSVGIETEFYNDSDLWDAYEEAYPESGGNPLVLSGPNEWAEINKATGEITDSNVTMIEAFLDFVEEYEKGDDDDSGDDDTDDDDDETPTDDDTTPDDDDSTVDDDTTESDDDSAVESPDCEGCQATVLSVGADGKLTLNSQALAWATLGTALMLRRRRYIIGMKQTRSP